MSERWLLALPLLAACGACLWLGRRLSALHPVLLAVGLTAAVGTFYPLATLAVTPITWRNVRGMPEEVLLGVQAEYLAFGLGLLALVLAGRFRRGLLAGGRGPRTLPPRTGGERRRDALVAWGLLAAGALLYALYVRVVGLEALLDKVDLAEKYRVSRGLGPMMFGLNMVIAGCLWAEAAFGSARAKLPFRIAALAVVAWSIGFIAVRSYSIAVLLGHLYLFCERRGIELRRVRLRVLAALLGLYLGLETYAQVRGSWDGDATALLEAVQELDATSAVTLGQVVGGSELSHPFITAMEVARYEEAGALGLDAYAEGLASFVPLALRPDRPPTIAQTFAAEYYPLVVDRGGGTAFSLVGEAWWSLGSLVGPFLVGLACGAGLLAVAGASRRDPHGVVARLVPYGLFLVLCMHRSSLGTSAKQLATILVPVLALSAAARLVGPLPSPRPRRARGLEAA